MEKEQWENIEPKVNAEAEFFEITSDFGNPLEILREAISNSIDANANYLQIRISVREIEGNKRLIIEFEDDGRGMTYEILSRDFWGLGFSPSREKIDTIGEKGHGTKIFLRSEKVSVRTQGADGAFESYCEKPFSALSRRKLHSPQIRKIDNFLKNTGTVIEIIGYNDNERSKFIQKVVKDYIYWFTKVGSIELELDIAKYKDFKVHLRCLDSSHMEELKFGHIFPEENCDIEKLFKEKETDAVDYYVKRYIYKDQRLKKHPEVTFDAVIYIEGDEIKRTYNPLIRERKRDANTYKVSERYGIWLSKDYIPISNVTNWISGFGLGSGSVTLVHGFINCQSLRLTANRGTIANTDPQILAELTDETQQLMSTIDSELREKGIYTLRSWQDESRTMKQEIDEFKSRMNKLKKRKIARIGSQLMVEPTNESELFGLFIFVYASHPDLFEFEPLDYNTTKGIDIIARNKSEARIIEGEHAYVEMKYLLKQTFNHAFKHIKWIVCWDFDKNISEESEFLGIEENDNRILVIDSDENGKYIYFLDNKKRSGKIQIIRLKEFLKDHLGIEFKVDK
jgi:hypothetical protein